MEDLLDRNSRCPTCGSFEPHEWIDKVIAWEGDKPKEYQVWKCVECSIQFMTAPGSTEGQPYHA